MTRLLLGLLLVVLPVLRTHAGPIPSGQPRDDDLTAIAALVCSDGQIMKAASGVWVCSNDAGVGGAGEPSNGNKTDITVAGGTIWTINNNAVTNAKLADMANGTVKCRATAGTGDPEDCTATQTVTVLDAQIATQTELNTVTSGLSTAGTINNAGNPVDWSKLKNVPAGFADGTDDGGTGGGGLTPVSSANCAGEVLLGLQTCIQEGTPPDPSLYFYCPKAAGCAAGEAVALPPVDTDTVGATSLQGAYDGGKVIMGVNSLANAFVLCTDNSTPADGDCTDPGDMSMSFYCDIATGCQSVIKPDGDLNFRAPTGFDLNFQLGTATHMRIDHTTGKVVYPATAGQPLKSVEVAGREFGACTYSEEVVATSKPKVGVFTCTTATTDGFDWDFISPLNWNAGTITVKPNLYSTAGSPTGNVILTCYANAVGDNDVIPNRAASGGAAVTLSLATTSREETATTGSITVQNTPVAGDHIYGHCDITSGTTATMASVRINATVKVFYTVNSTSE